MFKKYLLLSLLVLLITAQDEKYDLLANLSLGLDNKWEKIASIELSIEIGSGYIITDKLQLIPREVIEQATNSTRYLQLKLVSSSHPELPEILTTVDLIQNFPKGEIKEVVEINVDDEGNLNSFSYVIKSSVSKKNKKKLNTDDEDIDEAFKVQINKTSQSLSAHFQPPSTQKPKNTQGNQQQQQQQGNQQNQKEQQQPEQEAGIMGFLKNNFWYILIGLLVFNFMSNQNPEAAAGGQGGQGQARAPAPRQ